MQGGKKEGRQRAAESGEKGKAIERTAATSKSLCTDGSVLHRNLSAPMEAECVCRLTGHECRLRNELVCHAWRPGVLWHMKLGHFSAPDK